MLPASWHSCDRYNERVWGWGLMRRQILFVAFRLTLDRDILQTEKRPRPCGSFQGPFSRVPGLEIWEWPRMQCRRVRMGQGHSPVPYRTETETAEKADSGNDCGSPCPPCPPLPCPQAPVPCVPHGPSHIICSVCGRVGTLPELSQRSPDHSIAKPISTRRHSGSIRLPLEIKSRLYCINYKS